MRVLCTTLLAAVLAGLPARADEFDEPPDTSVQGGTRVATWEPVILAFYVKPPSAGLGPGQAPEKVVAPPTLGEAWAALRREVAIPTRALEPEAPVYSGWRMDTTGEDAGLGFEAHVSRVVREREDQPVVTFARGEEMQVWLSLDVLMMVSEDEKQQKLKDYFFLDERRVTIHRVSDDPRDVRAAAQKDPIPDLPVINDTRATPFRAADLRHPETLRAYPLRTPGVYELRVKARVRGRLGDEEVAETKDVEGAIRVAVAESKLEVRLLSLQKLNFYRTPRKPRKP